MRYQSAAEMLKDLTVLQLGVGSDYKITREVVL
jgi:hypothetical protein